MLLQEKEIKLLIIFGWIFQHFASNYIL